MNDGWKFPEEEGASDLEEAIARRLFAYTQWRNLDYKFAEIDWHEADREYCRGMARECIRQMEWASRVEGGKVHAGELTLAPEDWKP